MLLARHHRLPQPNRTRCYFFLSFLGLSLPQPPLPPHEFVSLPAFLSAFLSSFAANCVASGPTEEIMALESPYAVGSGLKQSILTASRPMNPAVVIKVFF